MTIIDLKDALETFLSLSFMVCLGLGIMWDAHK